MKKYENKVRYVEFKNFSNDTIDLPIGHFRLVYIVEKNEYYVRPMFLNQFTDNTFLEWRVSKEEYDRIKHILNTFYR